MGPSGDVHKHNDLITWKWPFSEGKPGLKTACSGPNTCDEVGCGGDIMDSPMSREVMGGYGYVGEYNVERLWSPSPAREALEEP